MFLLGLLNADVASSIRAKRASEIRGQEVFFGKGQCATCHTPPYYTDNLMHNLKVERDGAGTRGFDPISRKATRLETSAISAAELERCQAARQVS
jgi:cytochrome c peroxidase